MTTSNNECITSANWNCNNPAQTNAQENDASEALPQSDNRMRINRFLARSGIASRRGSEKLVIDGHVSINGKITVNLSTLVDIDQDIV